MNSKYKLHYYDKSNISIISMINFIILVCLVFQISSFELGFGRVLIYQDFPKTTIVGESLTLEQVVSDAGGIYKVELWYKMDQESNFKSINASLKSGTQQSGVWRATIPSTEINEIGTLICKFVGWDASGNSVQTEEFRIEIVEDTESTTEPAPQYIDSFFVFSLILGILVIISAYIFRKKKKLLSSISSKKDKQKLQELKEILQLDPQENSKREFELKRRR